METLHPNLRLFGHLKLLEVYEFYDVPVLVSCRTLTGSIYLAVAVKDSAEAEDWLYVALSHERFVQVRSGRIDLRSAFTSPENGVAFLATVPRDTAVEATVKALEPHSISDELLPAEGEFLNLSTDTLPALDSEEELAARARRNVLRFRLKLPEYARSEAPARALGLFLAGMQETVNSIAQSLQSALGRRGTVTRAVLGFSELAVLGVGGGSFEILVGSVEPPPMFDEVTEATEALEHFVELLAVAGNADQLQERLMDHPRIAGNLLGMLKAVDKRVELLQVKWASPLPGRTSAASLSGVAIKAAIAVIEHRTLNKKDDFWRHGRLVGASIENKSFQFWALGGEHYEGKVADAAMAAIDGATLGQTYQAHIFQVTTLKPASGETEDEFTLLALQPDA